MRIVDSFGTEAAFNYRKFSEKDSKYHSAWGNLELNLRQFMTMFRTFNLLIMAAMPVVTIVMIGDSVFECFPYDSLFFMRTYLSLV